MDASHRGDAFRPATWVTALAFLEWRSNHECCSRAVFSTRHHTPSPTVTITTAAPPVSQTAAKCVAPPAGSPVTQGTPGGNGCELRCASAPVLATAVTVASPNSTNTTLSAALVSTTTDPMQSPPEETSVCRSEVAATASVPVDRPPVAGGAATLAAKGLIPKPDTDQTMLQKAAASARMTATSASVNARSHIALSPNCMPT